MGENSAAEASDGAGDSKEFQSSMNEWIIFLDNSVRQSKDHIRILEKRITELEERQRNEG
jgi:hypothetical protein